MMIMSHKMILKIMTLCIKKMAVKLASFIKDARTEWVNVCKPSLCDWNFIGGASWELSLWNEMLS